MTSDSHSWGTQVYLWPPQVMSGARLLAFALLSGGVSASCLGAFPQPSLQGSKRKLQPVVSMHALGTLCPSVLSRGPHSAQGWPPTDDPSGMRWKGKVTT